MKDLKFYLVVWFLFPFISIAYGEGEDASPSEETPQASTPQTPSSYKFYSPGKEPPLKQKNAKPLRLLQSPRMKGVALVDYDMPQITIDTDQNLDSSGGAASGWGGYVSKTESGVTKYMPRVKITAKNTSIPESSLLVIEYFANQVLSKSKIRKVCVEHIPLPDIAAKTSVTVDAKGVEFYKYEHKSSDSYGWSSKHGKGLELYGIIISLFVGDKLVVQACSSSTLSKDCTETIPPAEAYEDKHPKVYQGTTCY